MVDGKEAEAAAPHAEDDESSSESDEEIPLRARPREAYPAAASTMPALSRSMRARASTEPAAPARPMLSADATVGKDLKVALMKARNAKGLSQKELANRLQMDQKTITEYEQGKGIPNNAIIAKIERELGCKLPRPPKK